MKNYQLSVTQQSCLEQLIRTLNRKLKTENKTNEKLPLSVTQQSCLEQLIRTLNRK